MLLMLWDLFIKAGVPALVCFSSSSQKVVFVNVYLPGPQGGCRMEASSNTLLHTLEIISSAHAGQ